MTSYAPRPKPWLGGSPADYSIVQGRNATLMTCHEPSGQKLPCVEGGMEGGIVDPATVIGLVNLGVGIYNAYQLHKVREQNDALATDLHVGLTQISQALTQQGTILSLLVDGQRDTSTRLDLLRRELRGGFSGLQQLVVAQAARDRADEFERRVRKVSLKYQYFMEALGADGRVPTDAHFLVDAADDLRVWADAELGKLPAGSPERLPFWVARVFAMRVRADVAAGERQDPMFRSPDLRRLPDELANEVRALLDGRSLFDVAVRYSDLVAQYALLRRGVMWSPAPDGKPGSLPAPLVTVDDGGEDLRTLFETPDVPERAPGLRCAPLPTTSGSSRGPAPTGRPSTYIRPRSYRQSLSLRASATEARLVVSPTMRSLD